uniref:WAP domain-containing protein n=1 Tax=Ditylenchus dipsaci TaxID=166011 RepID=A0A915DQE2_9BILA
MYSLQPYITTFLFFCLILLGAKLSAEDILTNPILVTPPSTAAQLLFPSRRKSPAKKMRNTYDLPAQGYSFTESLTQHVENGEEGLVEQEDTNLLLILLRQASTALVYSTLCANNWRSLLCQPQGECPTPIQLNIRCVKGNPINWCHHHIDCSRKALCCDSGCGYNVCVEQQEI